jgi:hypothetical protein
MSSNTNNGTTASTEDAFAYDESSYDNDEYDEYDVLPTKVRAGGGGNNRPFHTAKGTRAKEAAVERGVSRVQSGQSAGSKKGSKKGSK